MKKLPSAVTRFASDYLKSTHGLAGSAASRSKGWATQKPLGSWKTFTSGSAKCIPMTSLSRRMPSGLSPIYRGGRAPFPYSQVVRFMSEDTDKGAKREKDEDAPPPVDHPVVAAHLGLIAAFVVTLVLVGGATRLTESGLSITEWNLISGSLPPLSDAQWQEEWEKYKKTPEWRMNNQHMTLKEFKTIYFWEWGHRLLGRVAGLAFIVPLPLFFYRGYVKTKVTKYTLGAVSLLFAGQGALGWYMVKSGLDEKDVKDRGNVARVSQRRLTAHLGMALLLFVISASRATMILTDARAVARASELFHEIRLQGHRLSQQARSGVQSSTASTHAEIIPLLKEHLTTTTRVTPDANLSRSFAAATRSTKKLALPVTALVFLTGLTGAVVAGLDGGLVATDFPLMNGYVIPPFNELFNKNYQRSPHDLYYRNVSENPVTAQFIHRLTALSAMIGAIVLAKFVRKPNIRPFITPKSSKMLFGTCHAVLLQAVIGAVTLVSLVPVPLGVLHQAGNLLTLYFAVVGTAALRRPPPAVREYVKRALSPATSNPKGKLSDLVKN